jgi:hypothetical protein
MPNYHQLSTDAGTTALEQMNASQGHSGYLDDNSTSLYNMAELAVNYQPPVDTSPPDVHTIPPGIPSAPSSPPAQTPIPSPPGQDPTPPAR